MYNVVFKNTKKAGVYAGAHSWTTFESKEAFDILYTDEKREMNEVVAEGISDEECIKMCRECTPLSTRLKVALEESTDSETGETDEFILGLKITEMKVIGVI